MRSVFRFSAVLLAAVACSAPPAEGEGEGGDAEGESAGEGEGEGDAEGEECDGSIDVDPVACDFGAVDVGGEAFCDLSLSNPTPCEIIVSRVGFSDETPVPAVFNLGQAFAVPQQVPSGSSISLRLVAHPVEATASTGALELTTFALGEVETTVPLSVTGR